MSEKSKIILILGPTASGKSDIAVKLALQLCSGQAKKLGIEGAEIISVDSRQVYKGLDIGTGKITKSEMRGISHHLLDVASPILRLRSGQENRFTASDFKKQATKAIEKILSKNKIPIICGGTGFYIDALLGNKNIPEVPLNIKLRKRLEKKSTAELFEILRKLDKNRAKTIDKNNPRRLIRAIEICRALGSVPFHFAKASRDKTYDVLKIGIRIPDEKLKERIYKRLIARIKQGMIKEAENLHKKGLSWKRMIELGLEYKYLAWLCQKKISKRELIGNLNKAIWQYAKRQKTWFKKDKKIKWFAPEEIKDIEKSVKNFL
ncbi:MAG: tRNA (adenosine(37)-N6)-dimethylallyltransferase MiaA [Candidatus Zambryskibacteria bacterium]|nr:tRNA (adenosine(37)-N6)-dimethylallyltransferase MiaA [Candidatus Zambryskibacteria bacterium]